MAIKKRTFLNSQHEAVPEGEKMKKANDCALQHIKFFREQALKEAMADFGEPCQTCIHRQTCNFDWLSILTPLRNESDVKIKVVN